MENYENITHNIHEDSDHIQKIWRDKGKFLKNTQKMIIKSMNSIYPYLKKNIVT